MATIKEKLKKIPVELRTLIESSEVDDILEQIADEFNIPPTWKGEFVRPVVAVLVGDLPPKDFVPVLSDNLDMTTDEALMLARRVNEKIFSVVKPFLAELYAIEDKKIARKLKVPRKPKIVMVQASPAVEPDIASEVLTVPEPILPPVSVPPMMPIPATPSSPVIPDLPATPEKPGLDTAPIEVVPPPVQPTFAPEEPKVMKGATPSPMTMHFNIAAAVAPAPLQRPAELPTVLSKKLGGMRSSDSYREIPE